MQSEARNQATRTCLTLLLLLPKVRTPSVTECVSLIGISTGCHGHDHGHSHGHVHCHGHSHENKYNAVTVMPFNFLALCGNIIVAAVDRIATVTFTVMEPGIL
jgi:hypothetical protein